MYVNDVCVCVTDFESILKTSYLISKAAATA